MQNYFYIRVQFCLQITFECDLLFHFFNVGLHSDGRSRNTQARDVYNGGSNIFLTHHKLFLFITAVKQEVSVIVIAHASDWQYLNDLYELSNCFQWQEKSKWQGSNALFVSKSSVLKDGTRMWRHIQCMPTLMLMLSASRTKKETLWQSQSP